MGYPLMRIAWVEQEAPRGLESVVSRDSDLKRLWVQDSQYEAHSMALEQPNDPALSCGPRRARASERVDGRVSIPLEDRRSQACQLHAVVRAQGVD